MKLRDIVSAFSASRAAGLVLGCLTAGVLAGVVTAMVGIRHLPQQYEATMQLIPSRPEITSTEADWLESCAAPLRHPDALASAARAAGMDQRLGITPAQCAEMLRQSVNIQVTNADATPASLKVISVTCSGEDTRECAALLDGLAGVMGGHLSRLNLQREAALPGREQWLKMTAQLLGLRKEITAHEQEVRDALDGINARKVNLSAEELLQINPPLVAKASHETLKAATEKLEKVSLEAARLQPAGGYSFRKKGGSAPADATFPLWEPYAWPRAFAGGGAGLLLGIALIFRKRPDQLPAPAETLPRMKPVEY